VARTGQRLLGVILQPGRPRGGRPKADEKGVCDQAMTRSYFPLPGLAARFKASRLFLLGLLLSLFAVAAMGDVASAPAAAAATATAAAAAASGGRPQFPDELHFRAAATAQAAGTLPANLLSAPERSFLAQLPEVRVAVSMPPMRPYEQVSTDGAVSGIHPELLLALGRSLGLRLRPVLLPSWTAALEAAQRREVDLLMSLSVTNERLQFLEFTLGATPAQGALFGQPGTMRNVPLERARFALQRDYLSIDHVRRQYPMSTIVTVETTAQALRAVGEERADYYLGNLLEASEALQHEPVPGVQVLRLMSYGTGYYHFGVRKDWPLLASALSKVIQAQRDSPNAAVGAAVATLGPQFNPGQPLVQPLVLPAAAAEVLVRRPVWRVGAVRGLAMLNDVGANDKHTGIASEYTEQVAQRLGVAVQLVPFDSVAGMLAGLRAGAIDLVPFLTKTAARESEFKFSEPYLVMPYMLVARSSEPLYWGLSSLHGRRLALAQEHPLRELLRERHPQIEVLDVANGTEAMNAVAKGVADAAVEVKLFANLRINSDNDDRLRATAAVEELPAQFHFATAPAGSEILPLVNLALADIGANERERMLRRWVAVDLKPAFPWRRHLPLISLAVVALAAITMLSLWWMRRLSTEVRARRRSEQLLSDIAASVPGVAFRYVMHKTGALRSAYFTAGAKRLLGINPDTGQTMLANMAPFIPVPYRDEALALERACAANGQRLKITVPYLRPLACTCWLHTEAVQTLDHRGRVVWTGYVVDVSSERELQQRLAREAQARSLLLAEASHELRAPTHNLSLALQTVTELHLAEPAATAMRIAQQSAQTLSQLLDDVLDAARLEHGPLRVQPRSFELRPLLTQLQETWSAAAQQKGLSFDLELGNHVPALLHHDALRLKQVLTNLLSNACKYTAQGGFGLAVRVDGPASASAAGPQLNLAFAVRDSGPGMDSAAQRELFQPFVSVVDGHAGAAPAGSSGLGLVVCRRIAQAMGGEVTLQSVQGRGSVFTLRLPVTAAGAAPTPAAVPSLTPKVQSLADAAADAAAAAAAAGRAARPETVAAHASAAPVGACTVIVCDDDPVSRVLMAQILRLRGYKTLEAGDGASALAHWRDHGAHALVTDLNMPGMQGTELIHQLRAAQSVSPGAARLVAIICSGNPVAEADLPGLDFDAFLLKPLNMDLLVETLRNHGLRGLRQEVDPALAQQVAAALPGGSEPGAPVGQCR
jgi:two-component system, NarL family, sensor histidine kinase EvgS